MAGSLGFATGPLLSSALLAVFGLLLDRPYPPVFVAIGLIEVVLALAVLVMARRGRLQAGAASA
jgi:hypothetical protein